jgi:filamentous hemagglutinin family protein
MDLKSSGGSDKPTPRWSRGCRFVARVLAFVHFLILPSIGLAQVPTNITSSGLGTTITPNGSIHDITGGTRRGANLFHSFGLFNVGAGDTANFLNDTGLATSNILGRVNGGQTSSIFGTIKTTNFGNANLFLLNPFGWIFGSGATLDVSGSFHVSTANYLKFPDGSFFADNSPLPASGLTANPVAFGFLGAPLCASPCISVTDGVFLNVPEGQTLSLVGGDVQVTGGAALSAPSGRIQIGSFASDGEATVDGLNGSFASLGRVEISGGATISAADVEGDPTFVNGGSVLLRGGQVDLLGSSLDVSGIQSFDADGNLLGGTAGGAVVIRGGRLVVEGSSILAQTMGSESSPQAGIDIQMDDSTTLTGGSFLLAATFGAGRGGDIQLAANQVTIDGAGVATASFGGEGAAGDVTVTGGTISLANGGSIQSVVESVTGAGHGGNISVNASDSISMSSASGLFSVTNNAGTGGNISVSGPSLTMDGAGTTITALGSFGEGPGGTSGAIDIHTGSLAITDGAVINSVIGTTSPGVSAQAGNITVQVDGQATVSGLGTSIVSSASQASPEDFTVPAPILVDTGTLTLTDGALIQAGNFADNSQGGSVTVRASDSILISNGAGISSQSFNSDVGAVEVSARNLTIDHGFINTGTLGAGNAGDISIDVGTLSLTNGGQIASSSGANAGGNGGDISIRADTVSISGSSSTPALPEPFAGFVQDTSSGIFSTTATVGSGGNINVQVGSLTLTDGGTISANSSETAAAIGGTPGNAGNINIVGDTLHMDNGGTITVATLGEGNAGNVSLNVGSLTQTGGATIASSTSGAGQGGNVTVAASSSVSISGVNTGLFSTASSTGNAGEIALSAPTLTMADGGRMSVATSDIGNAGNISLNIGNLTQTGGARIDSSTTGAGAGGAITVTVTDAASIAGPGSGLFSTASNTGNAGQITVTAPTLAMNNGGTISVATEGDGAAGNVSLGVGELTLASGAQVSSSTSGAGVGGTLGITASELLSISDSGSGLFSTASSTGNAGQITVSTPTLTMGNGGSISVATSGSGNAGNLLLNVGNLTQTGGATIDSGTTGDGHGGNIVVAASGTVSISDQGSGLFSTASGTEAGGNVSVAATNLSILNGGAISANSTGTATATAGNIDIVIGDTLRMENSSITTEALVADGGNISITSTGSLLHMTNSQIATSVQSGSGGGGNITIGSVLHPFDFLVLNNSGIHADAFGGPGGNINIFTDLLLSSVPIATAITASSALNTPGTIDIEATVTQFTSDVSQLPEAPLQATELLRATCTARVAAGRSSSLVLGGRGGLPLEPGGLLPSPLALGGSAISFDHHRRDDRLAFSPSNFSLLARENNQRLSLAGWNQFQLAKTALGLDCGQ